MHIFYFDYHSGGTELWGHQSLVITTHLFLQWELLKCSYTFRLQTLRRLVHSVCDCKWLLLFSSWWQLLYNNLYHSVRERAPTPHFWLNFHKSLRDGIGDGYCSSETTCWQTIHECKPQAQVYFGDKCGNTQKSTHFSVRCMCIHWVLFVTLIGRT